ncbi:MAG: DUF1553 domain-containing protein [Planctomycetes bacterium]|nr:DUF1553 domain-containing protein [Planctomycetota bacterium]
MADKLVCLILSLTLSCAVFNINRTGAAENNAVPIDFSRDIRPILSDNCYHCHGPDGESREADLRLDLREDAVSDLGGHAAIVPGDVAQSVLVSRIVSDDADERMPPPDSGKELTAEQIALIRQWIEEGADWPQHWSFVAPKPGQPSALADESRINNDIDRYILAELATRNMQPSPTADRRTLIRRLTLDLTGLPPTREEVYAYLEDEDEGAYERLVDRLLSSPHFGERMAVAWLDQARYADTNGYSIDGGRHMWLWRDWVIDAYNQNMPFDQFAIEQLAGDLLPEATIDQQVATGFNRNHMITHEGGTIPAENLTNYAVDRVKTTAEVFLGLTLGCAQCHAHKYDPLTQKDFYRFLAFFNTLGDRGLDGNAGRNAGPTITANSVLGREEVQGINQQLAELEEKLRQPLASQREWEQVAFRELENRGKGFQLHPLKLLKVTTPNRAVNKMEDDGTVRSPKRGSRSPSLLLKADVDNITGLRIEFYPDESLPKASLGHGSEKSFEGSFILTSFSASADALPSDQVDLYKTISIREATASNSHPDYPPSGCLDPRDHNGWSPHPHNQAQQHITFTFDNPIDASETPFISTLMVWGGGKFGDGSLSPAHFRVVAITGVDDDINLPETVQTILRKADSDRTSEERQQLQDYYATIAPELANVRYEIRNLRGRLLSLTEKQPAMVMNTAAKPRETHILNRGQYDQPGELVTPGVPESLPPLPEGAPANRLGLARWLVDPAHPLTARVAVNRVWQQLFGVGIVASSADFGSQGQPPSHPELLDYLAVDFIENGWDVKRLIKKIVMSATYQQSSLVTPSLLKADPNNQWLARGPRFRLQAEFVRDGALQISGLLVNRIGGPSVKPYQPAGLWREISHFGSSPATAQVFVQDHGEKLYRRSMYTYWKRTVPPPSMVSFDAPNRELCVLKRATTNTPLQALVLLNDPQFVEASRALAERVIRQGPKRVAGRIAFAFELATARLPTEQETQILEQAYHRAVKEFQSDPSRAKKFLGVGESDRDKQIDLAEHAAWTSVGSVILNLSETITKG